MGRPIFFVQERPGLYGEPFSIFKFRTMTYQLDQFDDLAPDMIRMTLLGKYLRRFSLDELPQIINVLLGQMSFIGPRPLLMEYLPLYSPFQWRRHEVLPGITGWSQIMGRNQARWQERFEHDVWYVDNLSWHLDIKIGFLTLQRIISASGVDAGDDVTMSKFTGDKP